MFELNYTVIVLIIRLKSSDSKKIYTTQIHFLFIFYFRQIILLINTMHDVVLEFNVDGQINPFCILI